MSSDAPSKHSQSHLELAREYAQRAFFNSYLRDFNLPYESAEKCFQIPLPTGTFPLSVEHHSLLGSHSFAAQDLSSLIHQLSTSQLAARVEQGQRELELIFRERREAMDQLYASLPDFLTAEQGLYLGHNFHPAPKARSGFELQDLRTYAPEFANYFPLRWLHIHHDVLWEHRAQSFADTDWVSELYPGRQRSAYLALPTHPWQLRRWFQHPQIQQYLQQGLIFTADEDPAKWTATSSLRTLYRAGARYMLKFSMSLQLTNSLRHMQPQEIVRGMLLRDIFHTPTGQRFGQRFPQFRLMHEPACFALRDEFGKIMPETMVLLRENPFRTEDSTSCMVLATLNQPHPLTGQSFYSHCLREHTPDSWFDAFLTQIVKPLLVAQGDFGVLLGAHQQNLVVRLARGLPCGGYFRDAQGTGVSKLAFERFSTELAAPQRLVEHHVPFAAAKDLFCYYLIVNSVFSTISALSRAGKVPEKNFVLQLRAFLLDLAPELMDRQIVDHLLSSPTLKQKGNFTCSTRALNENTLVDPLSIYNHIPNPIALVAHP
mgnify:CR=1 FL=1